MKKESSIVSAIATRLRARGCFVIKLVGGPIQRAGLPDLLVISQGMAFLLEVKRPGEKATPIQEHTLAKARGAGAVAKVVSSVEEAEMAVFNCYRKLSDKLLNSKGT